MAYLKDIPVFRCDCGKPARVRLFNRYNAPEGEYCKSCGRHELVKLLASEAADRKEADRRLGRAARKS